MSCCLYWYYVDLNVPLYFYECILCVLSHIKHKRLSPYWTDNNRHRYYISKHLASIPKLLSQAWKPRPVQRSGSGLGLLKTICHQSVILGCLWSHVLSAQVFFHTFAFPKNKTQTHMANSLHQLQSPKKSDFDNWFLTALFINFLTVDTASADWSMHGEFASALETEVQSPESTLSTGEASLDSSLSPDLFFLHSCTQIKSSIY